MPVDNVNTSLTDAMVRRQVQLERFKKALAQNLAETLGAVDEEMRTKVRSILRRQKGATALRVLFKELNTLSTKGYSELTDALVSQLTDLAIDEAKFMATSMNKIIPINTAVAPPAPTVLTDAVTKGLTQGLTVDEIMGQAQLNYMTYYKSTVRQAMLEGANLPSLLGELTSPGGPLGRASGNLERTARTAANAVSSTAREQTYRKNSKLIKGVRWVSTLDNRTSVICAGLDGKVFPVNSGPRPPAHYNCRSTTTPIIKAAEDVVKRPGSSVRASMNGQVSGNLNFGQWLKTQPEAIQAEVLGESKARLFRAGMPIDRFTDNDLSPLTLSEIQTREPKFWQKAGL